MQRYSDCVPFRRLRANDAHARLLHASAEVGGRDAQGREGGGRLKRFPFEDVEKTAE